MIPEIKGGWARPSRAQHGGVGQGVARHGEKKNETCTRI